MPIVFDLLGKSASAATTGYYLRTWGFSLYGELGNGTNTSSSSPTLVGSTPRWKSVYGGFQFNFALDTSDSLYAWGLQSTAGTLASTTYTLGVSNLVTSNRSSPTQIGTGKYRSVFPSRGSSSNISFAVGRDDYALYAWGKNTFNLSGVRSGHLLPANVVSTSNQTAVILAVGADPSKMASAAVTTFFINSLGELYVIGDDQSGLSGQGTTGGGNQAFLPLKVDNSSWKAVATTGIAANPTATVVAIKSDGSMWSWGTGANGVLGNSTTVTRASPVQIGTSSWSAVRGGYSGLKYGFHAIRVDGTLWGWGGSVYIGDNTAVDKSSPVQIGTSSWLALGSHIINSGTPVAIRIDGALFVWGDNFSGQLGDSTTVAKSSPVQIGTSSWLLVSSGSNSTFAIRSDGALFAWGGNISGALGDGTTVNKSSPIQIGTSSWTFVSGGMASAYVTAAIRRDGALFTWGDGPLGDGTTVARSSPVQVGTSSWVIVNLAGGNAGGVSVGTGYGILYGSNNLVSWADGQTVLNRATTPHSNTFIGRAVANALIPVPMRVDATGVASWTSVASGYSHALGIDTLGRLYAIGANNRGQLGDGTITTSSSWKQIGTSSWSAVATTSFGTSAAIRADGRLFTWGYNVNYELGDGTTVDKSSPVLIGTSTWYQLADLFVGNAMMALGSDRLLYIWGNDISLPTIAYGKSNNMSRLLTVGTTEDKSWSVLSAGVSAAGGITNDGKLYMWGANHPAALVTANNAVNFETNIAPGTSWKLIVAAGNMAAAIKSDGSLWTWGNNANGKLGDGTTVNKSVPTQIGSSSWIAVATNDSTTAAIRLGGSLFTWGAPANGSLGDSSTAARSSPVQIGSSSWIAIGAGFQCHYAIRFGGTLFAWGNNGSGQLGDNTIVAKSSPVAIGTSSWTAVTSSFSMNHVLAIRSDGTLWAWGDNTYYGLGDYTSTNKSSPVQVGSVGREINTNIYFPASWSAVAGAQYVSMAIGSDGSLWAWGKAISIGAVGQDWGLGVGSTVDGRFPVKVGFSSWTAIALSALQGSGLGVQAAAIRYGDGALFLWGRAGFQPGFFNRSSLRSIQNSPMQVSTRSYTQVALGTSYTVLGLTSDASAANSIYSWGRGDNTENLTLGRDPVYAYSSPVLVGTSSWSQLSVGRFNVAAITTDKRLFMWGSNDFGQFGTGTNIGTSPESPAQITGSWNAVSVYSNTVLAVASNGEFYSWGQNSDGRAGTVNPLYPSRIDNSSWIAVDGGLIHSAGIKADGSLWTWGFNGVGQLGDGTFNSRATPVKIGTSSWTAVQVGTGVTAAIRSDGALFTWGDPSHIGIDWTAFQNLPLENVNNVSWIAISSGRALNFLMTYAIDSLGRMYRWGYTAAISRQGISYNDNSFPHMFEAPVKVDNNSWSAVSTSGSHTLAIRNDGTLWSWGNTPGNGLNTGVNALSPSQVGTSSWTAIATGPDASAAIRLGGSLFTWGLNTNGDLGDGTIVGKSSPVQIGTSSWTAVAISYTTTNIVNMFAIRSDGKLFGWGYGSAGGIGDSTTISKSSPVAIGASNSFVALGSAYGADGSAALTNFAIRNDGALFTWGRNHNGRMGIGVSPNAIGLSTYATQEPNYIPMPYIVDQSWTQVASGSVASVGLRSDGSIWTWGLGTNGSLGDGQTVARHSPVQLGTSSWTFVSAGSTTFAAIRIDGRLFTWGNGVNGSLGDGTTVTKSSPVAVGTSSWSFISAGTTCLAIRIDRALFGWGINGSGQIGNSSLATQSSPVQIGTSSWTMVNGSQQSSYGIRIDGNLFAWGSGAGGALGDGTTVDKSSPVAIGSSSWSAISSSLSSGAGISAGRLFTWGLGTNGVLGDGTAVSKSSPVQIGSSSWVAVAGRVSSGFGHYLGLIGNQLYAWGYGGATNTQAALGDNTTISKSSPVAIASGLTVTDITNYGETNAKNPIFLVGSVAWAFGGHQASGILADGYTFPVRVGTSSWTAITGSNNSVTAIRSGGSLFGWGKNSHGQLGLGEGSVGANYSTPTAVDTTNSWTAISALGNTATFAIRSDGRLFGAGTKNATAGSIVRNDVGYFGIRGINSPVQIGTSSWTAISVSQIPRDTAFGYMGSQGGTNFAAIRSDGALFTWGIHGNPLGLSTTSAVLSPTQVGTSSWTAVSMGYYNAHAIRRDGGLFNLGLGVTSGLNIGDGSAATVTRNSPQQIGTSSWSAISTGMSSNVIGIRNDGALFTWGSAGALIGDGTAVVKSSPVQIGSSSWTAVAMEHGDLNNLVAVAVQYGSNTVFTWGTGNNKRIGEPSAANRSSPSAIGVTSRFLSKAGGLIYTISNEGYLYGWGTPRALSYGYNHMNYMPLPERVAAGSTLVNFNQDAGIVANYDPVYATSLGANNEFIFLPKKFGFLPTDTTSWSAVSAGNYHGLAIRSDGALIAFGAEASGVLGNSSFNNLGRSPIQIGTSSWSAIATGDNHSMAIRLNGSLFTWGGNGDGQMGDQTAVSRSSPSLIGTSSWTAIRAGNTTSIGWIGSTLYGWGKNTQGQIGDNTQTSRSSPVSLGTYLTGVGDTSQDGIIVADNNSKLWSSGNPAIFFFLSQSGLPVRTSWTALSTPTVITNKSWNAVSGGWSHIVGLDSANNVYYWGVNQPGANSTSPILLSTGGTTTANIVAAGISQTMVLKTT